MTNHIAVLEDIRKEYAAYDNAHHQLVALDAAIALMRGQSEGVIRLPELPEQAVDAAMQAKEAK